VSLKRTRKLPEQEYLKQRFHYCEDSGKLYWKIIPEDKIPFNKSLKGVRIFNANYSGKEAGTIQIGRHSPTYRRLNLDATHYLSHRLIFKLVYGVDAEVVDHIDGDSLNNNLSNLRNVTQAVNSRNNKISCNNMTGYTGVYWIKRDCIWRVSITKDGRQYNLGSYKNIDEAIMARKEKEREFGFHENHGNR